MAEGQVVQNKSKGYGYSYSSLADLAEAKVPIAKMRVKPTEYGDYIEYFDEKTQEWQTGAKIVVAETKGMNAAQAYGAALTYARRYTVQMAQSVACNDDKLIERTKPSDNQQANARTSGRFGNQNSPATPKQIGYLKKLLAEAGKTPEEVDSIAKRCTTSGMASSWIKKAQSLGQQDVLPTDEEVA